MTNAERELLASHCVIYASVTDRGFKFLCGCGARFEDTTMVRICGRWSYHASYELEKLEAEQQAARGAGAGPQPKEVMPREPAHVPERRAHARVGNELVRPDVSGMPVALPVPAPSPLAEVIARIDEWGALRAADVARVLAVLRAAERIVAAHGTPDWHELPGAIQALRAAVEGREEG